MSEQPLAVVMGDLDLVSALGMAGISCVSVAAAAEPVRHSRFVVASIEPGDTGDPAGLVKRLLRFARTQPAPPVLFFQTDSDLLLASRYRDRLHEAFRYTLPRAELVEDLVDKARFHDLADDLGLPVPTTRVLRPAPGSADGEHPEDPDLAYPLVLKPLTRAGLTRLPYSGKAVAVHSADETRRLWHEARLAGVELLAQELVRGPETAVESYHAYAAEEGRVSAEFTGVKVRTRPATFGYSTAVRTTSAPDLCRAGRALVEQLGFQGVLKADYKRDEDGTLRLLEVNPRFSLWNHLGAAAGVNIPALVYADLTGRPRVPGVARAGRTWCQVGGDRRAAAEQGISLAEWLPWALRTAARAEGRWSDPMPVVRGLVLPKIKKQGRPRSAQDDGGTTRRAGEARR